jgi:hypothetical protein
MKKKLNRSGNYKIVQKQAIPFAQGENCFGAHSAPAKTKFSTKILRNQDQRDKIYIFLFSPKLPTHRGFVV